MGKTEDELLEEWLEYYRESWEKKRKTGGIRKMWQKIKENLKAQGFLSWCSLVVAILALLKAILFE